VQIITAKSLIVQVHDIMAVPTEETPVPLSVALSPTDVDTVSGVVNTIQTKFAQWKDVDQTGDEVKSDAARHELLRQARLLVQSLETPRETMIKHCWAEVRV
jgi:hypothetical protein